MRLHGASVFLDFDGTVTTKDTGLHVLERLAAPAWTDAEARFLAGEVGSRECMTEQWACLPRDRGLIEAVTREVPLDPAFSDLVELLRSADCEVTILSDGFGFYAEEVGAQAGLAVRTNRVDWERFALVFAPRTDACPCDQCGTCKQAPIREAKRNGRTTVVVGDGASDAKAAELADVVFAKGHLAAWCAERDIAHTPFDDLGHLVAQLRADPDFVEVSAR